MENSCVCLDNFIFITNNDAKKPLPSSDLANWSQLFETKNLLNQSTNPPPQPQIRSKLQDWFRFRKCLFATHVQIRSLTNHMLAQSNGPAGDADSSSYDVNGLPRPTLWLLVTSEYSLQWGQACSVCVVLVLFRSSSGGKWKHSFNATKLTAVTQTLVSLSIVTWNDLAGEIVSAGVRRNNRTQFWSLMINIWMTQMIESQKLFKA